MSDDLGEWFAEEHARATDLGTSYAAAISVKEDAKAIASKILREIMKNGPGTQATLAMRTGLPLSQVWKRLSDLKNWGYIIPSGATMPGPSGRQQTIWILKPKKDNGNALYQESASLQT